MCIHDGEEYSTCAKCYYEVGYDDALDGEPREPEYKNLWQIDEYYLGYDTALEDMKRSPDGTL